MNSDHALAEIQEAVTALKAAHGAAFKEIETALYNLTTLIDAFPATAGVNGLLSHRRWPRANDATMSVEWRGKHCFLGNTLVFRFFARLARTPNRYVSHVDLLDEVWEGERNAATIRGVAKRLRDELAKSGMRDLAVDGSVTGYYGLRLI